MMPIRLHALPLLRKLLLPAALALPAALLPSASAATTVSMGYDQGCSAADTGQVTCWGSPPLPALGPDYRAKDVRVGRDFGCLLAGNTVRCWGNNDFQQLGKTTAWGAIADVYATQIATGATHACALVFTYIQCWGDASQGQLGPAYMVPTAQAVQVEGLSRVKHVAAGNGSTCAVQQAGTVVCVGAGSGLVEGSMDPRLPRTVPGITDAQEVALFDGHACVLRTGGKISCWGSNLHGELGVPASSTRVVLPVEVTGLAAAAKAVAVGYGYTCALLVNGSVSCWGNNANGQLGAGLGGAGASQVTGITDATAISAGKSAACAVLQGGYVNCWGEGAGWSPGICRVPGRLYPGVPASWGPIIEPAVCHSQGSAAPMAVKGLGPEQDATLVMDWAAKAMPQLFPTGPATVRDPADKLYLREYPGGHQLAVNGHGSARLLYQGPQSDGKLLDLGGLPHWVDQATQDLAAQSGIQFRAAPYYNLGLNTGLCNLIVIYWVRSTHPGGLPAGFAPTSLRVEKEGGVSAEVPIRDRYVFPTWTSETDWSGNVPQPDPLQPIPPGVKQEPVHRGVADGCVTGFYGLTVDVILTYTIDGKKGQVRTRAQIGAAS
ncbi:hypothetical protein HNP48_006856 [Acidovorax soli]|uniref:Regulator of chromosome condensation (RCC1) repeat-containing protein n=1 Tax=Acidovorax soli TaxID=592050 RepID=A0A7X0PLG8_9BURK|nr:regulator [Acidovorax soli]MBB6564130.1 hypothetical protein [Acidovorax soli]